MRPGKSDELVAASVADACEIRQRATAERAFAGDAVGGRLDDAAEFVRAGLTEPGDRVLRLRLLVAIADERRALDEHDRGMCEQARVAIHRALRRLRGCASSDELSHRAPGELRDACGFTRVMISRARGSRWFPDTVRVGDGANPDAEEFDRFAHDGNEIPLGRMLPETQMVRQRVAVMVADAASDPRAYKPLIRVTQSTGYVAAPIMAGRRVIGFLHADRVGQHSSLATGDLENIALFANEFGILFERAVLAERMERQRSEIAAVLHRAAAGLDVLCDADMALGANPATVPAATGRQGGAPAPRRDALLTAREREILDLVASGATNDAVARELVLSPDTVKTHVSSILRKLHAATRAEAVARYLHLR
jgi:DNA-binding CsgD family transcriptional regulator